MRRLLAALLAGVFSAALGEAALAFPNEPGGFRGLQWGQEVAAVPELAYTCWQSPAESSVRTFHETFDYKVYERKDDEMRIGSVPLSSVRYLAWQGRLRGVVVTLRSKDKDGLLAILTSRFGKARQERRGGRTVYGWAGDKTTMELAEEHKTVELRLTSSRLAHEERVNRREHAVRHLREKETLDRKAVEQGEGF